MADPRTSSPSPPAGLPWWLPAGRARTVLLAVVAIAALSIAVVLRSGESRAPRPVPGPVPTSAAMEDLYGLRITRVALTADGGLVDLRYVILDATKLDVLAHNRELGPFLEVDGRHLILNTAANQIHPHLLRPGSTSFVLFRNAGNAIRGGSTVSVVIGHVALRHLTVLY